MYLKAMIISCKDIMPAALAKAIVRLAQYLINKTSYCISHASRGVNKITWGNKLMQVGIRQQST